MLGLITKKKLFKLKIISSPSYLYMGTLVIVQIFDFRFLTDLHVLGYGDSKKLKISMVSGCSLASMCITMLVNMLVC